MEDNLGVEIYDGDLNSWEICPPLPADFRSGNSSQSLCSGLFKERFYVFGIYSGFVSSFDLEKRVWSDVRTLRPPGVVMSCLISCGRELMLAGLCNDVSGHSFNLWRVDELTMEFSVVAIMPSDLLNCLFDSDGDDQFASLKCVGHGNFIFVFNEEHRRNYPACVCEITPYSGECRWRRVPDLPEPVNRFHKVIGFCSTIPIHRILGSEVV
ncbi:galactose oxidase/kelch repeat superfamily protein [Artemisia annua]|uniref:Galactose oxidase/kelch repeat superfamily protein n=1 Tax=Artemisia annua TaxID=35608 RepID=A0A2U1KU09_ARTAN|nr:galactose oxidase/kelch repeat superfamily protein [Artemisia annua]